MRGKSLALALAAAWPASSFGGSADIVVEAPWARASVGASRPGAAYMTVRNTGSDSVTLTGLASDVAAMAELHETTTDAGGVSAMAAVGPVTIGPAGSVALEPGGLHAMLMHLQRPLVEGETIHLTLNFDDGGEVTVEVPVLGIAARGPEG